MEQVRQPGTRLVARGKVVSIQRIEAAGLSPEATAAAYFHWIERFFHGLVRVHRGDSELAMSLPLGTLLVLERTGPGAFAVKSGLLGRDGGFAFHREGDQMWVVLDGFRPRLPWWLYKRLHGPFHEWTVQRFARFLVEQQAAG